jgi:hypothetical protein
VSGNARVRLHICSLATIPGPGEDQQIPRPVPRHIAWSQQLMAQLEPVVEVRLPVFSRGSEMTW